MRMFVAVLAVALPCAALTASASLAGSITARQAHRANVYGLVQAGRRPSSVDVEQQGAYNVIGVMQATPDARFSSYQRGGANLAIVRQLGFPTAKGAMP